MGRFAVVLGIFDRRRQPGVWLRRDTGLGWPGSSPTGVLRESRGRWAAPRSASRGGFRFATWPTRNNNRSALRFSCRVGSSCGCSCRCRGLPPLPYSLPRPTLAATMFGPGVSSHNLSLIPCESAFKRPLDRHTSRASVSVDVCDPWRPRWVCSRSFSDLVAQAIAVQLVSPYCPHSITWRCQTTRRSPSALLRGSSTDAASRVFGFGAIQALAGLAAPPQGCFPTVSTLFRAHPWCTRRGARRGADRQGQDASQSRISRPLGVPATQGARLL